MYQVVTFSDLHCATSFYIDVKIVKHERRVSLSIPSSAVHDIHFMSFVFSALNGAKHK